MDKKEIIDILRRYKNEYGEQYGIQKMDAICMRLIVIGKSLKNLDKISSGTLLPQYQEVD